MPSRSKAQQKFFGAELARKRAGKETQTDMSMAEMDKMASTPHKGLPEKARGKGKKASKSQY
jgi:hypothetical protein